MISSVSLNSQTSLEGSAMDGAGEPVLFGTVIMYLDGALKYGAHTDFDGNYRIVPVEPGIYDVELTYVGYDTVRIEGVMVEEGEANLLDFELTSGIELEAVKIIGQSCFPQPEQVEVANIVGPVDIIWMHESPYFITSYEKGVIVVVNEEVRGLELWMEDELIAKWRKRKPGEYKVKVKKGPTIKVLKLISGTNDFECRAVY